MPELDADPPTTTLLRAAYDNVSAAIDRAIRRQTASQRGPDGLEETYRPLADLPTAHRILIEILASQDGLGLRDLAARAGIAIQSMSVLIDDLVSTGYLQRFEPCVDQPGMRIWLTDRGGLAAAASRVAMSRADKELRDALGDQPYQDMRRSLAAVAELSLQLLPPEWMRKPAPPD